MIVGFTGTRDGMTSAQREAFVNILAEDPTAPRRLHHGDCFGADEDAHWVAFELGRRIVLHPPVDERLRAYCSGADAAHPVRPYLVRNKDIVDASEILVACPKELQSEERPVRSGTWSTVRYAIKQGKPVRIVWPDGAITT